MIEPQNTMMPLSAEPVLAEAPQGAGFGEMLAQSLGLVSAVYPNAVQQIASGNHQDQEFGEDAAELPAGEQEQTPVVDEIRRPASVNSFVTVAIAGAAAASEPTLATPSANPVPVVVDVAAADPKSGQPISSDGGSSPTLPESAAQAGGPELAAPVDGTGKPISADASDVTMPQVGVVAPVAEGVVADGPIDGPISTADPESAPTPVGAPGEPMVAGPATIEPAGPVAPAPPSHPNPTTETPVASVSPPDGAASEPVRNTDRGVLESQSLHSQPVRPDPEGEVPVGPAQTEKVESVPAPPTDAEHVVVRAATAQSRIDLNSETPVRIDNSTVGVAKVATTDVPTVESSAPSISPSAVNLSPIETAVAQPVAGDQASPAATVQNSALADRVMRAVELQANQPPPRTMVVDIPEIEGLRLVVSVRGGAQVHVVPTTGSSTPGAFQPFMDELANVLADRGFVMTGDGRQRGNNPYEQRQQVPFRSQRPAFRRPAPSDNDLRI